MRKSSLGRGPARLGVSPALRKPLFSYSSGGAGSLFGRRRKNKARVPTEPRALLYEQFKCPLHATERVRRRRYAMPISAASPRPARLTVPGSGIVRVMKSLS